jgi:Alginate export
MVIRSLRGFSIRLATPIGLVAVLSGWLYGQYDKVAALGSDSALTPIGGPASSPLISTGPYDLPDLRPTGRLNDQLPKWLQFGLDERLRWEGYSGSGFKPNNSDSYLLNRFRFGVLLLPASWFRVVAQVQDARSFLQTPPIGPPNNVRWDLKQAYAQLGSSEGPLYVTAGRQLIDYNSTIIANSEWRNQARSYDGLVTNIHLDRFRAALFAASVVVPQLDGRSHHQEGNNIYGAYTWITRVVPKSSIEPFVLWRVEPRVAIETAGPTKTGHLDEKAYGIRVRGTSLANIDYRYELINERGAAGSNRIEAWATTAGAGYTMASFGWKPRIFSGYDYASGDKNPADGMHGTFDTMYPTAHDRLGITDQLGWQNIVAWRAGGTVTPHRRWSLTAQYLNFWLASTKDGIYNSSGGLILRDTTGRSSRHIGEEADFYTWYEINRQVHVGAGVGHMLAGQFLARASKGVAYTYPYLAIEMLDGKRVH